MFLRRKRGRAGSATNGHCGVAAEEECGGHEDTVRVEGAGWPVEDDGATDEDERAQEVDEEMDAFALQQKNVELIERCVGWSRRRVIPWSCSKRMRSRSGWCRNWSGRRT